MIGTDSVLARPAVSRWPATVSVPAPVTLTASTSVCACAPTAADTAPIVATGTTGGAGGPTTTTWDALELNPLLSETVSVTV